MKNFVSSGSLPDGQKAEAIVILLSRGIAQGISLDDCIVFNLDEKDIEFLTLTEINQIRLRAAKIVDYFIATLEINDELFEEIFLSDFVNSDFFNLLKLSADALMRMSVISKQIPEPQNVLDENEKRIESAREFAEADGYSEIFAEIVLRKILEKNEIVLKSSKEKIDKKELNYTILMDKKALYISDEILDNSILPEIASTDVKSIVLRKKLEQEGLLLVYQSESGSKTNKRKRPLCSLNGEHYQCWMTAIDRNRLEEITEVNFDDLMEEMQYGK